jgi:hypothetical protein
LGAGFLPEKGFQGISPGFVSPNEWIPVCRQYSREGEDFGTEQGDFSLKKCEHDINKNLTKI